MPPPRRPVRASTSGWLPANSTPPLRQQLPRVHLPPLRRKGRVQKLDKRRHRLETANDRFVQLRCGRDRRLELGIQEKLLPPQEVCRGMLRAEALRHARELLALQLAQQALHRTAFQKRLELAMKLGEMGPNREQSLR